MSADIIKQELGETHFRQEMPVPTYLISLCVGVLAEKFVSPRCSVISEPSYLDFCANEFEETEKFL